MPTPTVLLVDGNAIIHRSFHALPPLTAKDGTMVNAVYGFATALLKALKDIKPTHVAVAFDMKGPTFRDAMYDQYKATRVQAAQELYDQIPLAHELVAGFGFPVVEVRGVEADDVIGTLSQRLAKEKAKVVILTGDMDTMQLVSSHVSVYSLRKGLNDTVLYTPKQVVERYGFGPEHIIDYKALRGDPSDNIPGVKGVGEKTATDLILRFKNIEAMYRTLEHTPQQAADMSEKLKLKLMQEKDNAYLSKKLATIKLDVSIPFDLDKAKIHSADATKLHELFVQWGFKSLVAKIPQLSGEGEAVSLKAVSRRDQEDGEGSRPTLFGEKSDKHSYTLVDDEKSFKVFLAELEQQKSFVFDTETTSLNPYEAKLLGISFSWKAGAASYVNVHKHASWLKKLKPFFADSKVAKWGHNLKYDSQILELAGQVVTPLSFDSMLASYLLNSSSRSHNLDTLAFAEFGHQMIPIEELIGKKGKDQVTMEHVDVEKIAEYSGEDADYTYRLVKKFQPQLKVAKLEKLFTDIEMPLIPVLSRMELAGVKLDTKVLAKLGAELHTSIRRLEKQIHGYAKSDFNISSPLQLKVVLFETLKLPTEGIKKTKTGISTAVDELEKLQGKHPIIDAIMEYREVTKLLNTYVEALPELVQKQTGRVHTDFNQTVAATGRLSSNNPNLQNIPIRTELGREIRKAFIAEKGFQLVSVDYSQIELRVVASLAKEEKMIDAFKHGADIHQATAADIFNIPVEQVTKDQRSAAKEVNFGVLYGMGAWGLASRKKISREQAQDFIERYFASRPKVAKYLEEVKEQARKVGYVETLFGRRRNLPELNSSNGQIRSQAERIAVNLPVQGTAADILKLAMIACDAGLPKVSPKARMILTVHDELVFEVPDKDVQKVSAFVKKTMEGVYDLAAPLVADVKVGDNWGEMEEAKS
ncbi:MAG: DNA polymerase I [Patescibacteria group bacterium]|jgi:DNA polymerase-1